MGRCGKAKGAALISKALDWLARALAKAYPDYYGMAYNEGRADGFEEAQETVKEWYEPEPTVRE